MNTIFTRAIERNLLGAHTSTLHPFASTYVEHLQATHNGSKYLLLSIKVRVPHAYAY